MTKKMLYNKQASNKHRTTNTIQRNKQTPTTNCLGHPPKIKHKQQTTKTTNNNQHKLKNHTKQTNAKQRKSSQTATWELTVPICLFLEPLTTLLFAHVSVLLLDIVVSAAVGGGWLLLLSLLLLLFFLLRNILPSPFGSARFDLSKLCFCLT